MASYNPECMGSYDFDKIAFFARKRFIEGFNTVELIENATSEREKEEIALVSLLDVKDDEIRDLQLTCIYADRCKVMDCRDRLRKMLKAAIKNYPDTPQP